MAVFILTVVTEPKDECADGPGREPAEQELLSRLRDELSEIRRDYETPWMVTSVEA